MRRIVVNIGVCLGIVVLGLGVAVAGVYVRRSGQEAEAATTEVRRTNVVVQVLTARDIQDGLLIPGSLEPWLDVTLSAETMGKIERQPVDEGDRVSAGDEIVHIDTTTIQTRYQQTKAQFQLAKQELERVEDSSRQGISSPQDRDRANVDYDVAMANLKASEIELAASVIRAKIDGVVDTLEKEEGEYVTAGTNLVRIVQVDRLKLVVGIPERDIPFFSIGDRVTVTLDAYGNRTFQGVIYRIATTAEESTHTFVTEIALDNDEGLLKPGMIARAHFIRRVFEEALSVPLFSIISTDRERYVFVESEGVAELRPVEIGFIQGDQVQIAQGLNPGDRLIIVGQRDLRDQDPVNVSEVRK